MSECSLMGGDLNIYRKGKQCWVSAPVQCLLNLKERELHLKRIYNITAWFLLWELCIQVTINVCNSESIFSCCQVGEIEAWSNWMTNKATAKKHLFKCCEATGETELSLLCCNVWLFPWGIPKPWPWPSWRMAEGSIGSCCTGSCCSQPGVKGTGKDRAEISVWLTQRGPT